MAKTEAQKRANRKYSDSHYDRIAIRLPAGTRQIWKDAAAARGLSLAAMIAAAVAEYIRNH